MSAVSDSERLARAFELVALVEESWPAARFTDDHRKRYAADVVHLDPDEAVAAVEVLKRRTGRDGRAPEYPPPAGDVCREVARLQVDAPDWGEVKRQLVKRWEATLEARETPESWTCPYDSCDGSGIVHAEDRNDSWDCRCRRAMIDARRAVNPLHPLIREFIDERYATWGEVEAIGRGMQTTLEAQMRAKWEAFAHDAVETRALSALAGPDTLRRLHRARDEDVPRKRRELDLVDMIGLRNLAKPGTVHELPRGTASS